MLENMILGPKTFWKDGKPAQDSPLKLNLPTFGDILYGLWLPEVPHFRENSFNADIAGSILIDGINFSR